MRSRHELLVLLLLLLRLNVGEILVWSRQHPARVDAIHVHLCMVPAAIIDLQLCLWVEVRHRMVRWLHAVLNHHLVRAVLMTTSAVDLVRAVLRLVLMLLHSVAAVVCVLIGLILEFLKQVIEAAHAVSCVLLLLISASGVSFRALRTHRSIVTFFVADGALDFLVHEGQHRVFLHPLVQFLLRDASLLAVGRFVADLAAVMTDEGLLGERALV